MNPDHIRRVVMESPYMGDVGRNVLYARACVRDSLLRGEGPLASHLLYTQAGILDDTIPAERVQGIAAGHAWIEWADSVVVYTDLGISGGMNQGIRCAQHHGITVEYRKLLIVR